MLICFQVDAGSYTQDSGGLRFLDPLVLFRPSIGEMEFAPPFQKKIEDLRDWIPRPGDFTPKFDSSPSCGIMGGEGLPGE